MTPDSRDDISERKYRDEEWLREKYIDEQQSVHQVANSADCTAETIRSWLRQFDIDIRDPEAGPWRDEAWLRTQYIDERKSTSQIADEYGSNKETIRLWLGRHGIETRGNRERQLAVRDERKYRDEEWLRTQYIDEQRTGPDIADECGVSAKTIYNWLEQYGVEVER